MSSSLLRFGFRNAISSIWLEIFAQCLDQFGFYFCALKSTFLLTIRIHIVDKENSFRIKRRTHFVLPSQKRQTWNSLCFFLCSFFHIIFSSSTTIRPPSVNQHLLYLTYRHSHFVTTFTSFVNSISSEFWGDLQLDFFHHLQDGFSNKMKTFNLWISCRVEKLNFSYNITTQAEPMMHLHFIWFRFHADKCASKPLNDIIG